MVDRSTSAQGHQTLTLSHTFDLSGFSSRQIRVGELLTQIQSLATELGSASAESGCAAGLQDLRDETVRLVFVGEFSRGKSTLINALLGARVLPMGAQPVTTILNHIRFGEQQAFRVVNRDGRVCEVTQDEFQKIVAPPTPVPGVSASCHLFSDAIDGISKISHAEVLYPSSLCRDGVEIIDTPGTNDVDTVREQITYEFIPRADAILFLLSACEPIGASEMLFLRERVLRSDVQRIFFPVTFADQLDTDEDREKVRQHIVHILTPLVGPPRLFFVNGNGALKLRMNGAECADLQKTGLPELEKALASFLVNERAVVKLRKPVFRGVRASQELRNHSLLVAEAGLSIEAEELHRRLRNTEPRLDSYRVEQESVVQRFRGDMIFGLRPILERMKRDLTDIAHCAGEGLRRANYSVQSAADMRLVIEKSTAAKQTEMQTGVAVMRDRVIGEAYERAARALDLRRTEIENGVIGSIAVPEDSTLSTLVSDYKVRVEQAAGMSGPLGSILLGITRFVSWISPGVGRGLQDMALLFSAYFERLAGSVEREYLVGIPKTQKEFDVQWGDLTDRLAVDLVCESELRMSDLNSQLNRLRAEATANETERNRKREEIRSAARQLSIIETELRYLGGWSSERVTTPSA